MLLAGILGKTSNVSKVKNKKETISGLFFMVADVRPNKNFMLI